MRRPPLLVFAMMACLLLLMGIRLWLLPNLQHRFEQKLASWMEREHLLLRYEGLRIRWYGLRLDKVQIEGHGIDAAGSLELHLRLWPDLHFAHPERLVLDRWKVRWSRSTPSATAVPRRDASVDAPVRAFERVQSLLQGFRQKGMLVELKNTSLDIEDDASRSFISLPKVNLTYATGDQALQIDVQTLIYRQKEILKGIEGQVILQPQHERFPFLLTARDTGDIPWQLQGSFSQDFNALELRHKRSGLPPSWRSYLKWIRPQNELQILLKLSVEGLTLRENLDFDIQVASNNLHFSHHLLGEIPWGPFPFSLRAKGRLLPEKGALFLQSGMMHLAASTKHPPVRIYFSGVKSDLLAPMRDDPLRLSLSMPETPCQILLDALPEHAFPLLNGFSLQGTVGGQARLQLLAAGEPTVALGPHALDCRLKEVPERFSARWLKERRAGALSADELREQPALAAFVSPQFVPLSQIPENFLNGLISAEDGGFWRHEGFRVSSLLAALQANLRAGKVIYGGSTLTMQLVKNLYLNREKVLSRKVQELFLAWAIEQVLSKEDILEIYANIVEFGPRLHGIGPASRAYFDKEPRELNNAEAVFLSSIMPSPFRHFQESYCEGRLNDTLLARMEKTARGVSVLSRHSAWMSEYANDLRNFRFKAGSLPSSCARNLTLGSGRKLVPPKDIQSF